MHNRVVIRVIFPAFEFALTPFKSKFVSFKFPKNAASSQNGPFNLDAVQTGGEFECSRRVFEFE